MRRSVQLAGGLITAVLLSLAAVLQAAEPPLEMPADLGFDGPRAQLLLLGTFHFKDAGLDGYKPKYDADILSTERQRQLAELLDRLAAFAPTKIAVEVNRERQDWLDERYGQYRAGEFELTSNEIYQLGFRLAERLGHERLWAVDAESRRYEPSVDREKWAKQHDQRWILDHQWHERFEKLYLWEDEQKTQVSLSDFLLYLNSPERVARGHGHYLVGGFKAGDGAEYPGADHLGGWWYVRNLRIFANLLQLARNEDERVLLIVGAGHLPILLHAARSAPGVELVEVSEVLKK